MRQDSLELERRESDRFGAADWGVVKDGRLIATHSRADLAAREKFIGMRRSAWSSRERASTKRNGIPTT